MNELLQILEAMAAPMPGRAALATLVRVEGSSYRRPGARMLVTADGRRIGSISGGCLEDDVAAHAGDVLQRGVPKTVTYDTTAENDQIWGVGLGCHGVVHVLIEYLSTPVAWVDVVRANLRQRMPTDLAVVWGAVTGTPLGTVLTRDLPHLAAEVIYRQTIRPPAALVVFGAGNDAQPLVHFAKGLGWHVTVADPRPALASPARFPEADAVVVTRSEAAPDCIPSGPDTLVVVMTHHYRHDLPLLRALISRPVAYLGLLGPRNRATRILDDLAKTGAPVTPELRARLHAPVGLDLGAEAPEEVALSILAEMQAALTGRDARPLRDRRSPIHG